MTTSPQAERFPWSLLILGCRSVASSAHGEMTIFRMHARVASENDPYGTGTSSSMGHSCPRIEKENSVRVPRLAGDFDLFGAFWNFIAVLWRAFTNCVNGDDFGRCYVPEKFGLYISKMKLYQNTVHH